MNPPQSEISFLDARSLEGAVAGPSGPGGWSSDQWGGVLYRDNLIYLPFAAHLSQEDAHAEAFAKAA